MGDLKAGVGVTGWVTAATVFIPPAPAHPVSAGPFPGTEANAFQQPGHHPAQFQPQGWLGSPSRSPPGTGLFLCFLAWGAAASKQGCRPGSAWSRPPYFHGPAPSPGSPTTSCGF